jgi:glucose/arabinose dehydrogenase
MHPRAALRALAVAVVAATPLIAQQPGRGTPPPLPPGFTARPLADIDSTSNVAVVNIAEFATIPDAGGAAPRLMSFQDEPGTRRLFVNEMRGGLFSVSYDGKTVTRYLDTNDSTWGQPIQSQGRERGLQAFAFHPQFAQAGTPGYGKFYTWADVQDTTKAVDFKPGIAATADHDVLLEWTAKNPRAATYDGGPPRELMRWQDPYANHNGGALAFNPLARAGSEDFGLLYVSIGDGGSGGDPNNFAQNLGSAFGKLFRIDPLGKNSPNGKYGIPSSNPFAKGQKPGAMGEIYAYGIRNIQRLAWDPANGDLYYSEIGQNVVEEIGRIKKGDNLGWNIWEGSYKYGQRGVDTSSPRSDASTVYPLVEFQHADALWAPNTRAAASGLVVYRGPIGAIRNKVLFSELVHGEVFWFDLTRLPQGGSSGIHRVLFRTPGSTAARTMHTIVREKNEAQGKTPAPRVDPRLSLANDGRVFVINKGDGVIRVITP